MYSYPLQQRQTKIFKGKETIQVTGSFTIKVEPDAAIAFMGVLTSNKELQVAQQENSVIAQRILHSLYKNGIEEKDIQTSTYQIYPQYDYVDGKQLFKGYDVRQVFRVQITDLNQVGKIIDDAVNSGANIVERIEFSLLDIRVPYLKALAKAYDVAYEKAKILAQSSGQTLQPSPINIKEIPDMSSPQPTGKVLAYSTESSTPIATGQIGVVARVQVDYLFS
ncbi:SIMPL domain-containing protein [Bacillus sp. 2205SS5-2]|uniref:SIMPL domain-containing protein n=1 Tax=Bacillus sp. 2205SS5-2 TaxID=3109031 RepID=UPI003006B67D